MSVWIDAQLSPAVANWIAEDFGIAAVAARDLRLRNARDREIFRAAREAAAIVLTKDADFVRLLNELGPPPQVIWLRCGNTSNAALRALLARTLREALALLERGEPLVEILG